MHGSAKSWPYLPLLAATLFWTLVGCGGGGGGGGSSTTTNARGGEVAVSVAWPEADGRLIPAASNAITVELLDGNGNALNPARTATLSRPTTSATLTDVPAGAAILRAVAYPSAAGGTAQANGQVSITVLAGQTITVPLSLTSTITKVVVTPNPAGVAAGSTVQLSATAQNSAGATVLVPTSGAFTWSVTNGTSFASVSSTGLVSGTAAGSATVQAKENESGVTGTAAVTVSSATGNVVANIN